MNMKPTKEQCVSDKERIEHILQTLRLALNGHRYGMTSVEPYLTFSIDMLEGYITTLD